jgi:D-3-phosphoglycerate dehydrogenase
MKIVSLEPLGIPEEAFRKSVTEYLPPEAQILSYSERPKDTAELLARAKDADVIVIANMPLRKEILEQSKNLKMISIAFTGVDHIDVAYCHERGIIVSNCAGYSTQAVGELVIGMALSLYRKLTECDHVIRNGGTSKGLGGKELNGKTFGIIGAGAIGLKAAALAQAFGCKVLAYSRTFKEVPGITFVSLDTLLGESDIVSIHVPSTPETRNMIDASKLKLMKPEAILINTARGPVVNSSDLAAALNNGVIAGAGLDVFDTEPPLAADYSLLHAKNTVLAPHIGFATVEALLSRCGMCLKNVACWLKSAPINMV